MKVTFVAMGTENISIEALSAMLKKHGIATSLVFDRALFNDKQYFPVPQLAKLFDRKKGVVKEIIEEDPDLLAFSVFADNYQWALGIARNVKKIKNIAVIFGGVHPTSVPELVIAQECVDIICVGEGDYPLLELAKSIENGSLDYSIRNLWFKNNGRIIRNDLRPLIENLDELPLIDKELFEKDIPISEYYLTVTSKGCIASCAYCSQNFFKKFEKGRGKFLREKTVDTVINELKIMRQRYNFKRVDIKNNVLSGSRQWTFEFLKRYKEEIGVPFRIMGHPRTIDSEVARALKKAGCWHIQLGVESFNPKIRMEFLGRYEDNREILNAIEAMDNAGLGFSLDYMVGLPEEREEDLIYTLKVMSRCKNLTRASVFWLEYLPKVEITELARNAGLLTDNDVRRIEEGKQENYLSTGSVTDRKKRIFLKNFHLLFRLSPLLNERTVSFIVKNGLHEYFRFLPQTIILIIVDILVSIIKKDHFALFAIKSVFLEIRRDIKRKILASFGIKRRVTIYGKTYALTKKI